MAKVLHPQIEMSAVSRALEIEKEYLHTAHEYFGLGSFRTLREIHKVSSYKKKLHGEFIKIGLLCDLDLDTKEDVDFVRLSLARAMAYCTDKEKGKQVSMENGPM